MFCLNLPILKITIIIVTPYKKVGVNILNFIEQQIKQREKEAYVAEHIINSLLCENCSQQEYINILKIVEERILNKCAYEKLECL